MGSPIYLPELLQSFMMAMLDFWHSVLPGFFNKPPMHIPRAFPGPASPAEHIAPSETWWKNPCSPLSQGTPPRLDWKLYCEIPSPQGPECTQNLHWHWGRSTLNSEGSRSFQGPNAAPIGLSELTFKFS